MRFRRVLHWRKMKKAGVGRRCGGRCAGSGWRDGEVESVARLRCPLRWNNVDVPDAEVGSCPRRPDARRR